MIEIALYEPEFGFYTSGGHAGRGGDFLTSPEVGPLFGHVVANAIDAQWDELGQPDEMTFVDFGAGPGTLARSVLASSPRCVNQLRYLAIERSAAQRARHPTGVISLDELTAEHVGDGIVGVVFANELLDNLAFTPVRWDGETALFSHVGVANTGELVEVFEAAPGRDVSHLSVGNSVVDQTAAGEWVREITESVVARGRLLVIDYARRNGADVEVRTYSEHGRAGDPLMSLGTKDITVDVDLEALQDFAGVASEVREQHEWLRANGIDDLVEQGRAIWEREAGVGGLEALRAKSRLREADSLCDPSGLGGFLVSEWVV